MEFLQQLWLPILVTSVAAFACSFLVWAILPHHKGDWSKLPNEDGVREFLKTQNLAAGPYIFPMMDGKDCNSPEGKAKWKAAPVGELRIWKDVNMGKNMFCTFLVFLFATILIAYISWHVRASMAGTFADRFQVAGSLGILAYCFSFIPNMIWFQASKRALINCIIDGVLYGFVTGAIFSWLWPATEKVLKLG